MTYPDHVPQPTRVWRDPDTHWDLRVTDDDMIIVSSDRDIVGGVINTRDLLGLVCVLCSTSMVQYASFLYQVWIGLFTQPPLSKLGELIPHQEHQSVFNTQPKKKHVSNF